jgi:hypothetical protein
VQRRVSLSASCSLPIATELHHRQPAATVVDGGVHGGELVLKEDDVHADAGEERVLLLQQFAELPGSSSTMPDRADDDVHLAES